MKRWRAVKWLVSIAVLGLLAVAVVLATLLRPLQPVSFDSVRRAYVPSDGILLDRHDEILDTQRVNFGVRRLAWTPLEEISPALITAVVAGEDRHFWNHSGVDPWGMAGAARDAIVSHRARGASTITMQLASLLEPSRPRAGSRSVAKKLRQIRLATGLESRWSKQQILEAYLNLLQFRGELQGVRAAARVLAHKAPSGLSTEESVVFAALLPAPSATPERVALRGCARQGASAASAACLEIGEAATRLLQKHAGADEVERLAPHLAASLLKQPGQHIRTTIDAATQRVARNALNRQLNGLGAQNVRDAAAIVVDNETGDVLAYVGSAGAQSRAAAVDGVRAPRQAGSTLKPFLYGLALERHYVTAASLLDDVPVNIDTATGVYIPQDYDHDYKGPVSVRTSLGGSLNVPAVRTLMLVGVESLRDRLHELGYAGIKEDGAFYGYSLALGSAEVTLWEQAQAYRTLALGGRFSPLRILAEDPLPKQRAVLPVAASFIIGDILSDRAARAVTFGLGNSLATGYWSAVKTGTSKDMRDNWCIGYSTRYTVAVWVGNFEGDAMHDVSGVTGAAPAWREIMDELHEAKGSVAPAAPAGVSAAQVRYSASVEPPRREWFLDGTAPHGMINSVASDARLAHITNPVNAMVIAMDPDIPDDRQRVPITVQGGASGHVLRLDGSALGHATETILWEPTPGAHRLALEDQSGRVLDRILFTVR
ncbi:MAG: penicillin-binding protein 1C [Pseudomonadota bacterium]